MEVHGNVMACHESSWQCHGVVPWRFVAMPSRAMGVRGDVMACHEDSSEFHGVP